jgi:hypothetical protein
MTGQSCAHRARFLQDCLDSFDRSTNEDCPRRVGTLAGLTGGAETVGTRESDNVTFSFGQLVG